MRRPARRLFTLCSAASLLLCVAVCVLWARSHFVVDQVNVQSYAGGVGQADRRDWDLLVEFGVLRCQWSDWRSDAPGQTRWRWTTSTARQGRWRWSDNSVWQRWGFHYSINTTLIARHRGKVSEGKLYSPVWLPAGVLAVMPSLWFRRTYVRYWRKRRLGRCLCPACGYDLRASPERCPECGGA